MIIYQVEPQYVDLIWSSIVPLLKKPLETGLGEVGLDNIKEWIKNKGQQLWLFLNEEEQKIVGVCTTQIIIYPNAKHLQIHLVGAANNTLKEWMEEWPSVAAEFCKKNDISHIEIMAHREGWERLLKDKGYKKYYTVLVKDMKDD
jgi:hypothetical protein